MMANTIDFQHSSTEEPHIQRTKDIIRKYPEIKKLMGKNPNTFWWALLLVLGQVGIAFLLRDQAWWIVLIVAPLLRL